MPELRLETALVVLFTADRSATGGDSVGGAIHQSQNIRVVAFLSSRANSSRGQKLASFKA